MHIWDPRFSEAEKKAQQQDDEVITVDGRDEIDIYNDEVVKYNDLIEDHNAAVAKLLKDGEL